MRTYRFWLALLSVLLVSKAAAQSCELVTPLGTSITCSVLVSFYDPNSAGALRLPAGVRGEGFSGDSVIYLDVYQKQYYAYYYVTFTPSHFGSSQGEILVYTNEGIMPFNISGYCPEQQGAYVQYPEEVVTKENKVSITIRSLVQSTEALKLSLDSFTKYYQPTSPIRNYTIAPGNSVSIEFALDSNEGLPHYDTYSFSSNSINAPTFSVTLVSDALNPPALSYIYPQTKFLNPLYPSLPLIMRNVGQRELHVILPELMYLFHWGDSIREYFISASKLDTAAVQIDTAFRGKLTHTYWIKTNAKTTGDSTKISIRADVSYLSVETNPSFADPLSYDATTGAISSQVSGKLFIYDLKGAQIFECDQRSEHPLSVRFLPHGLYFVVLSEGSSIHKLELRL